MGEPCDDPMNIMSTGNGQSQVPPGFRFHPTEEELLQYYLRKKVGLDPVDWDVIQDVDLNKLEPWEIQEKCRIGSTPQNDWYFFSHKDKKYPTGTRTNRATAAGFWKATGRDKVIYSNSRRIGMRKTLVFYTGRAPRGQKSDWIMHEYRLKDSSSGSDHDFAFNDHVMAEATQEDGWVICRVFKKKYLCTKTSQPPTSTLPNNYTSSALEHPLVLLNHSSSPHFEPDDTNMISKLPCLQEVSCHDDQTDRSVYYDQSPEIQDWAALDHEPGLVGVEPGLLSSLFVNHCGRGQTEDVKSMLEFDNGGIYDNPVDSQNGCFLWRDQTCHIFN